jgi:hypothetical protein
MAKVNRKEAPMRLNNQLAEHALSQFDAQIIPESHPAIGHLNELFGDHTFFLDMNGLHIVEPAERTPTGVRTGKIVKLASWSDANHTSLAPHRPEETDTVLTLETGH